VQRRDPNNVLSSPKHLAEAKRLREEADKLPYGAEKEMLLKKARRAETAARAKEWLASPGLQSPE